jgi:hypothetical protein
MLLRVYVLVFMKVCLTNVHKITRKKSLQKYMFQRAVDYTLYKQICMYMHTCFVYPLTTIYVYTLMLNNFR